MKGKFLSLLILSIGIFLWSSCGREVPTDERPSHRGPAQGVERKLAVKGAQAVSQQWEVEEVLFIENKGYGEDRKEAVMFTHRKHGDERKIACIECHHPYKEAEGVWRAGDPEKRCIDCHDPLIKKGYAYKLQTAFHRKCRRCHRIRVLLGKSEVAPFKTCGNCHGRTEE